MNKEFREGKEFKWFFQGLCCLIVYTAVNTSTTPNTRDTEACRKRCLFSSVPWSKSGKEKHCNMQSHVTRVLNYFFFEGGCFFICSSLQLFIIVISFFLLFRLFSITNQNKMWKEKKRNEKKGGKTLANMFRGKVVTLLLLAFCYGSRRTHTWARKRKTVSYKTRAVLVQFVVSFCFFLQLV